MAFSDVIGDRKGCPPHLAGQVVLFLGRQLLDEAVCPLPELSSDLVQLEVIQSESPFFHRRISHSPLTTHHSPPNDSAKTPDCSGVPRRRRPGQPWPRLGRL